jgi:cytochrome oxidase Cu insertion factor (SCO1/SenC/PrrC family)
LTATVAVCGIFTALARADGDPASDYLVAKQVFLTSLPGSETREQQALVSAVQAANRSGFAIRVATVSTEYDLGSITELWRKPQVYARFLGLELSSIYKQRLLVIMPNGFGFNWPGHSTASAYRLLAGIRSGAGDSTLAATAEQAVRQLAKSAGATIPASASQQTKARSSAPWILVAAAVIVLLGAAAVVASVRRRRRRPPRPKPLEPEIAPGGPPGWMRWAAPGVAAVAVLAIGTPIALLAIFRHAGASGESVNSIVTPPALRDQTGHTVSVAQYRGRPVIVTFVDPLCRNLCPLEAHLLNQVVGEIPAAQRPAILAVSVDHWADSRKDLLQDERQWELVPEWHWAVGSPGVLAQVWKHYEIGVSVVTKKISGTTINYITHTEAAYVIDSTGHERALFVWPFYPQDLRHTLAELS